MKRQYDIRVRPHEYHRGQWVLYYNRRRYQGRQQKWQRKFSPHLVVRELPPVNYLVQKSKRSRPFITHIDKLKPWHTDNPPKSWLTEDDGNVGVDVTYAIPTTAIDRDVIHAIPTTELDQDVIRLVEMMMRGQAVRPLIVTMGEERYSLRGWFISSESGSKIDDVRRQATTG